MTRGAFSRSDIIVILEDEYFILATIPSVEGGARGAREEHIKL